MLIWKIENKTGKLENILGNFNIQSRGVPEGENEKIEGEHYQKCQSEWTLLKKG